MRNWIIAFLLLLPTGLRAQTATVSAFAHMNTSTPGTPLTGAIANAGTDAGSSTANWAGLVGSGLQVGAGQPGCAAGEFS